MRTPLGSAEDMAGANLSGTTARREIRDKMKAVRDRVDKGAPPLASESRPDATEQWSGSGPKEKGGEEQGRRVIAVQSLFSWSG